MHDKIWTTWTFKLGNVAFKNVRPRMMVLKPETFREAVSMRWFFFKHYIEVPTGRWTIVITFDKGPYTSKVTETVFFDSAAIAETWFNEAYSKLFTEKGTPTNKKAPHLFLISED
jgi:hypothetical protein